MQNYRPGDSIEEAVQTALRNEAQAFEMWEKEFLLPWQKRHNLGAEQVISLFYDYDDFDSTNPSKPLVTLKALRHGFANGQANMFITALKKRLAQKKDAV